MSGTRTKKMHERYQRYQKTAFKPGVCVLCSKAEVIKTFKYWKIVVNIFPWDRIAKTQHMVIPKRHITYTELNKMERAELEKIKLSYLSKKYDILAEATYRILSISKHFHIHLIILK